MPQRSLPSADWAGTTRTLKCGIAAGSATVRQGPKRQSAWQSGGRRAKRAKGKISPGQSPLRFPTGCRAAAIRRANIGSRSADAAFVSIRRRRWPEAIGSPWRKSRERRPAPESCPRPRSRPARSNRSSPIGSRHTPTCASIRRPRRLARLGAVGWAPSSCRPRPIRTRIRPPLRQG